MEDLPGAETGGAPKPTPPVPADGMAVNSNPEPTEIQPAAGSPRPDEYRLLGRREAKNGVALVNFLYASGTIRLGWQVGPVHEAGKALWADRRYQSALRNTLRPSSSGDRAAAF